MRKILETILLVMASADMSLSELFVMLMLRGDENER